jgi:hypothetical protein
VNAQKPVWHQRWSQHDVNTHALSQPSACHVSFLDWLKNKEIWQDESRSLPHHKMLPFNQVLLKSLQCMNKYGHKLQHTLFREGFQRCCWKPHLSATGREVSRWPDFKNNHTPHLLFIRAALKTVLMARIAFQVETWPPAPGKLPFKPGK